MSIGARGLGGAFAIAALSLSCFTTTAVLADQSALTAQLQSVYDGQCADLTKGDFTSFASTLSPDFTTQMDGRTITRDDMVNALKASAARVKLATCTATIDSVTQTGNTVVVTSRLTADGTATGPQGDVPIEFASGKRDVWRSAGTSFLETSSADIWSTITVNGQVVQQTGTPPSPPPLTGSPSPSPSPT